MIRRLLLTGLLTSFALVTLVSLIQAQSQSITTTFAHNNGYSGNMFDITATNTITVVSFDIHTGSTATETVHVYYKSGTYAGHENTPGSWTLLGTETVTGAGAGSPTAVSIGGLGIPAGETYGLYVTIESYDILYTDGANTYSDANVTLDLGVGIGFSFGTIAAPRTWNGTIYYEVANRPPDAVDDTGAGFITNEDTALDTWSVLSNDTDPDGDTLAVDSFDDTGVLGVVTDNKDGTFNYDPDGKFADLGEGDSAFDPFTYTVSDGNGGTDTAEVTMKIVGVNDPPVAEDDDYVTAFETPLTVPVAEGVLDNDTDPEDDVLTAVLESSPVGELDLSANGSFVYTPTAGFHGADTFTYHAADGLAISNVATATINVLDPTEADLEMGKVVDDGTPDEGATVVYTLTVTNNGPADATGIEVQDTLPAGLSYVADDGTGAYDGTTWDVEDLDAAASAALRITVTVDAETAGTTITNTAAISVSDQEDPVTGNDEAEAVIDVPELGTPGPPIVTIVSPEPGEKDVPLGADVVITFSEAIDAATFTYTVAPDPGGWMKAWNGAMTQVTLSHDDFERWTHYTVMVAGAEDLAGNAMEHPYAWSFTTAPHWQFLPIVVRGLSHQPNRR